MIIEWNEGDECPHGQQRGVRCIPCVEARQDWLRRERMRSVDGWRVVALATLAIALIAACWILGG